MEEFDIEAYLNGELTKQEENAFENAMKENPSMQQEVEMHRQIVDALKGQGLREQVEKALKEADDKPSPFSKYGIYLLLLIPLIGILFMLFLKEPPDKSAKALPTNSETTENTSTEEIEEKREEAIPEKEIIDSAFEQKSKSQTEQKSSSPIAEYKGNTSIRPIEPPTTIRGKSEDNEEWDALMNRVWVSGFPPANTEFSPTFNPTASLLMDKEFNKAFVKLRLLERKMPANDTLLFLKGYCLTELREGRAALEYFDKMSNSSSNWTDAVEWYSTFDYLLIGNTPKANSLLNKMAKMPTHSYRKASENALSVLK